MKFTLQDWKEIEIKDFKKRKVSREFQNILLQNAEIDPIMWSASWIKWEDIQKANDYLVFEMTNLTNEKELDEISEDDFNKILEFINKEDATPSWKN